MLTSDEAIQNRQRIDREQREKGIERRLRDLKHKLGPRYADCSLENFKVSGSSDCQQRQTAIIKTLSSYSAEINDRIKSGIGIAMFGAVGTGKDHLLSALLYSAVVAGRSVEWRDGMRFAAEFRDLINSDESEWRVLGDLINADVLAISDPIPPTGGLSPFIREKLFAVVDQRYRAKRPTWLTLNVANRAEAEDRLSAQIVDRITDGGLCLSFDWPSHRLSRRWTEEQSNG